MPSKVKPVLQGDLLFLPVNDVDTEDLKRRGFLPWPQRDGKYVLALGEKTGHAHVVDAGQSVVFADEGREFTKQLLGTGPNGAEVIHLQLDPSKTETDRDFHGRAVLEPNTVYRVIQQHEYREPTADEQRSRRQAEWTRVID